MRWSLPARSSGGATGRARMREDDGDAAHKAERGRLAGPRTAGVVRVRRGAPGRRGGEVEWWELRKFLLFIPRVSC
jgi:hypothetical protein